ncbi:MAG: magnesium transporter [Planctomycetota bacterium]
MTASDATQSQASAPPQAGRISPTAELLTPEIKGLLAERELHELRRALDPLAPADIADILAELLFDDPTEGAVVFRLLRREHAGDVFAELTGEEQAALIAELGAGRTLRLLESMDADDRAAALDEMPAAAAKRLLVALDPEDRREVQAILGYPPESVGRLMTPDYVRVRPEWSVARSLEHIRRYGKDAETVHWVYVIDDRGRLIDDLHIRTLLLADPVEDISTLMDSRYIALDAMDDQEEAVHIMNRYDRTALPVVDARGVLLGIVTIDDVADVAEEEATEDIQKLGGMEALENPYLKTALIEMIKKRGGWLCGLFVLQLLTIGVMGAFDEQLNAAVVIALFVPLIISSGGNTGTQAASLLIRALALHELSPGDWVRVLRKELLTGVLLGAVLGVLGAGSVLLLDAMDVTPTEHAARMGLTVGLAVLGIVVWAVMLGSMFPLILSRMGFDPATISSPLVATVMDVSGLLIYFGVAVLLLRGTLL